MKCLNQYFSKTLNQYINYEVLKSEYLSGTSLRQIEVKYGISRVTLSRHLKQDGITIAGNNANQPRRYLFSCNEDFFETIDSEDKAYCLGFFLADGSFLINGIKFDQTEDDKEVLEYINKCLEGEQEIKTYPGKLTKDPYNPNRFYQSKSMCRLAYSHIKLREDLQKLGLQPNKTYNFTSLNVPTQYWNDFMRGFLDGDGCITMSTHSFSINYTIKNSKLADFIIENSKPYYQLHKHYDIRSDSYRVEIESKIEAQRFKQHVYHSNFHFCLQRKLDVLNKILGN